jgi:hypothetical protein
MKCLSCSGVSPSGSKFCQFCGGTQFTVTGAADSGAAGGAAGEQAGGGKIAELAESVLQIKDRQANKFRWLPFIFNVSYLAGYGNTKEANRTMGILLGGYLIARVFSLLGLYEVAAAAVLGTFGFGLYYCYLLSTRIDTLVTRDKPFNWPVAIGYAIVYGIVSSILTHRL